MIDLDGPACPSTYHEFEGPEPIPYDTEGKSTTCHLSRWKPEPRLFSGTDRGNIYKVPTLDVYIRYTSGILTKPG
jgi:hypothetical protein